MEKAQDHGILHFANITLSTSSGVDVIHESEPIEIRQQVMRRYKSATKNAHLRAERLKNTTVKDLTTRFRACEKPGKQPGRNSSKCPLYADSQISNSLRSSIAPASLDPFDTLPVRFGETQEMLFRQSKLLNAGTPSNTDFVSTGFLVPPFAMGDESETFEDI